MAVLERGGNAFDAACAAGFVLQVVEPHLNGPGGDLPAVFWSAEAGKPLVLCAQGVVARGGDDRRVPRSRARSGARDRPPRRLRARARSAAGSLLLEQFGTWPLADVLEYAIGYAEHGYPVIAGHHGDDRARRAAAARSGPRRPSSTCRRRARVDVPEPAARGDVAAAARRVRADRRRRATRLLRGVRRGRDRPVLARARRAPDRRRPGAVARDARAAGDARLPRADGVQDRRRGGRGRRRCSSSRCSRATTSRRSARRSSCTSSPRRRSSRSPTATRTTATRDVPLDLLLSRGVRGRAPRADRRGRERRAAAGARPAAVASSTGAPSRSARASRPAATPSTSTSPTASGT